MDYSQEELNCIKMYYLKSSAGDDWDILIGKIQALINEAKQECFDSAGEVNDLARGKGKGLEELLTEIETDIETGRELVQEDEQARS